MIDGWPEVWEQELLSYLLSRATTTPSQVAEHFHCSDSSTAYWLGCLIKSGKLGIARIERKVVATPVEHVVGEDIPRERAAQGCLVAILQVSRRPNAA